MREKTFIREVKIEPISKMWIRVQGKARVGEKAEHTRKYVSPASGGKPTRNPAAGGTNEPLDAFLRWVLIDFDDTGRIILRRHKTQKRQTRCRQAADSKVFMV